MPTPMFCVTSSRTDPQKCARCAPDPLQPCCAPAVSFHEPILGHSDADFRLTCAYSKNPRGFILALFVVCHFLPSLAASSIAPPLGPTTCLPPRMCKRVLAGGETGAEGVLAGVNQVLMSLLLDGAGGIRWDRLMRIVAPITSKMEERAVSPGGDFWKTGSSPGGGGRWGEDNLEVLLAACEDALTFLFAPQGEQVCSAQA